MTEQPDLFSQPPPEPCPTCPHTVDQHDPLGACTAEACTCGHRNAEIADEVTDEAIERVEGHADTEWKHAAFASGRAVAQRRLLFPSDDVRDYIVEHFPEHSTHNWSALGAVMRRLAAAGYIERTTEFVRSDRPGLHRDLRPLWRSLIFGKEDP